MIDIENKVLSVVREAVLAAFPNCAVYSEYVEQSAVFPCITITEDTNYTYVNSLDNALHEHHAECQYSINVYSAKQTGAKLEAKAILNVADNAMQSMRFWRTMTRQVPNMDITVYRLVARYRAVVEEPKEVGNDLVYQMYQK